MPDVQHLWAHLLVDELVRCGVGLFCLAPGSRSTPLTVAVAEHPDARHLVHVDERGTAFCALGYARATGRPAAWITTSGTAVANGLPAVVEAATDAVPLLLLTADRPSELRATGANQTIDQPGLFGGYVRWQFDLPVPSDAIDPAFVCTTADQAVYRSRRAPAGPVHLNCMFREPLTPTPASGDAEGYLASLAARRSGGAPYTTYAASRPVPDADALERLARRFQDVRRGLLVAGRLEAKHDAEAALRLAQALGWPILPDIGSGLRLGNAPAIHYYDALLADAAFGEAHTPEAILHLGERSTSKRLAQLIARHQPPLYAVVRPRPARLDPDHLVSDAVESDVRAFADGVLEHLGAPRAEASWAEAWLSASHRAHERLEAFFDEADALSEPFVAHAVARHLPEGHGLVVASSMPVRDLDAFAAPGGAAARVASNRGASGIDGTVATAAGFARGLGAAATLLIGDLALLHDLNSLALLRAAPHPVTVVAINNDGGGIFHFLPIARHEGVFEPYFGTPHGLTFEGAARLFGLDYARPETPADFVDAYRAASEAPTSTLIEVTTNRAENHELHQRLLRYVAGGT